MSTSRTGRVLVATSGSATSQSAITFAARVAASRGLARRDRPRRHPHRVGGAVASPRTCWSARRAVRCSRTERRSYIGSALTSTSPPRCLPGLARRPLSRSHATPTCWWSVAPPHDLLGRLWTGSTVTGVAARATCPVAIIPAARPRAH